MSPAVEQGIGWPVWAQMLFAFALALPGAWAFMRACRDTQETE